MVGVRDVAGNVFDKIEGKPFRFTMSPVGSAIDTMTSAVANLWEDAANSLDQGEADVSRRTVRGVGEGTSIWWGLPGRQAWTTSEYLYDVSTGQVEAEDPFEFTNDLLFVRPPERRVNR